MKVLVTAVALMTGVITAIDLQPSAALLVPPCRAEQFDGTWRISVDAEQHSCDMNVLREVIDAAQPWIEETHEWGVCGFSLATSVGNVGFRGHKDHFAGYVELDAGLFDPCGATYFFRGSRP